MENSGVVIFIVFISLFKSSFKTIDNKYNVSCVGITLPFSIFLKVSTWITAVRVHFFE